MSGSEYDFLVFIGRFQPFHFGHLSVIKKGLVEAKKMIILLGSAHQPRSMRNPWIVEERESMIRGALTEEENLNVFLVPLEDTTYNDTFWIENVQSILTEMVREHHSFHPESAKIGLIGQSKGRSLYYPNLFPQWGSVAVNTLGELSSTFIRESYFNEAAQSWEFEDYLPGNVIESIVACDALKPLINIREEYQFVTTYREAWKHAPYEPTFVTVDSVVVQSGHILLIERKNRPGKGLLALPGGFVDRGERLVDACIRELKEETRLKVSVPVLRGAIKSAEVFDAPHRSARGRTITHAFYIELQPCSELPKAKGGDDAKHAMWVPVSDLVPSRIFEDHYSIIQKMVGV